MSKRFGAAALALAGFAQRFLGWTPETFWNATPAELAACFGEPGEADGLTRPAMAELMRLHPDE